MTSWFFWRHTKPKQNYFNLMVEVLATYNAERARGIVHTPEWDAQMRKYQEQFDAQQVPDR